MIDVVDASIPEGTMTTILVMDYQVATVDEYLNVSIKGNDG